MAGRSSGSRRLLSGVVRKGTAIPKKLTITESKSLLNLISCMQELETGDRDGWMLEKSRCGSARNLMSYPCQSRRCGEGILDHPNMSFRQFPPSTSPIRKNEASPAVRCSRSASGLLLFAFQDVDCKDSISATNRIGTGIIYR